MKKKGFTLIELLAVIVVLGLTFLFVGPKLVSLIKEGENTETELIEERILSAAKDYVNYVDGSFYKYFYKEGDTNYIYKTDLIKNGLITEEEASKLNTFSGVKGELLSDDKIRYTIEYINASPGDYTVEELYTMIQSLNDRVDSGTGSGGSSNIDESVINDLQNQINAVNSKADKNATDISNIDIGDGVDASAIQELQTQINANKTTINSNTTLINQYSTNVSNLTNKDNSNNVFLKTYPVGSIYVSNSSTNPGTVFGGTWVSFGTGRTLVGVDASQTEFATVEKTGGAKTHTLTVSEIPSHTHIAANYASQVGWTGSSPSYSYLNNTNDGYVGSSNPTTKATGGGGAHNNLQPYITVYMWKRTA